MSAVDTPTPPQSQPVTPLITVEEFFRDYGDGGYELVKGKVIEVSMPGAKHGKVCQKVTRLIGNFAEERNLGHVMSNDTLIVLRRGPDTSRGADVCFVSYAKLPAGDVPDGPLEVIPDLVFEVRSPSDGWSAAIEKMLDYLKAGVSVVVILDPKTTSATLFRSDVRQEIYEAEETLAIPDLLPGFAVPVRQFFE
jgi:Uma2 family endonuclease